MSKLKPCRLCGKPAIVENWSSGGTMYMVKCSNPDCYEQYPRGRDLLRVVDEWNRTQNGTKGDKPDAD